MDISTIVGIVGGLVVIVAGIVTSGDIMNFFDPASIFIVFGGTIGATVASYPLPLFKNVPKHMKIILNGQKYKPEPVIDILVDYAQEARRSGLLALESKAAAIEDPFFRRAVMLVVDASEADKVKEVLEKEIDNMIQRHEDEASMYDKAASYAPAFGMIGTLVGLINMLKSMNLSSGSSSDLGLNMAVALVTTFYGVVFANLVLMPLARKLSTRTEEEVLYRQIIVEGVLGIQAGDNPKTLKERLVSYLSTSKQISLLEGEGGESGKEEKKKRKKK